MLPLMRMEWVVCGLCVCECLWRLPVPGLNKRHGVYHNDARNADDDDTTSAQIRPTTVTQ